MNHLYIILTISVNHYKRKIKREHFLLEIINVGFIMDLNMKINYEDKCLYCTRIIKGLNDFNRDQHIQACKKKMEHLKIIKV